MIVPVAMVVEEGITAVAEAMEVKNAAAGPTLAEAVAADMEEEQEDMVVEEEEDMAEVEEATPPGPAPRIRAALG